MLQKLENDKATHTREFAQKDAELKAEHKREVVQLKLRHEQERDQLRGEHVSNWEYTKLGHPLSGYPPFLATVVNHYQDLYHFIYLYLLILPNLL